MKKYISLFLVVFMVMLPVQSCGKKTEENKTTIKFGCFYSDKAEGEIYKDIAKEFEKKNKNLKVEVVTDFSDPEKVNETITKGGEFDIVGIKRSQLIEFAKSGYLSDISTTVEEMGNNIYNICKGYGKYNGKYYGIGDMPNTYEWFYNMDIFEKNGLSEPKNSKELISLLGKLKSKGINPIGIGAMDSWTLTALLGAISSQYIDSDVLTLAYGTGTNGYSKIKGISTALDDYIKLLKAGANSDDKKINYRQSVDDFVKGRVAIFPAGSWARSIIDENKSSGFKYSVFENPVKFNDNPVEPFAASGGEILTIPLNSKNNKDAVEFLKFLFSEEAQKIFSKKGFIVPMKALNTGKDDTEKKILSHLDMTDEKAIMLIDNLEPKLCEAMGEVLYSNYDNILKGKQTGQGLYKSITKGE